MAADDPVIDQTETFTATQATAKQFYRSTVLSISGAGMAADDPAAASRSLFAPLSSQGSKVRWMILIVSLLMLLGFSYNYDLPSASKYYTSQIMVERQGSTVMLVL